MGATAVLEMAAAMPPARKSLAKEMAVSLMFRGGSVADQLTCEAGVRTVRRLKWPTPSYRRGDLRRLDARDSVNFDSCASLVGCEEAWAGLVDTPPLLTHTSAPPHHQSASWLHSEREKVKGTLILKETKDEKTPLP